ELVCRGRVILAEPLPKLYEPGRAMRYTVSRWQRAIGVTAQRLDAVFFRLESGGEPVREWLKDLPKDERKAIGEDIAYVQFKWPIGKPHVDHLDEEPSGRLGRRWPIVSRGHSSRSRAGSWCCLKCSSRRHSSHR